MADELIIAIGLVLVIEGGLYALFPERMQRAALQIGQFPPGVLRNAGLLAATVGVGIVWLLKR